MTTFQSLKLCKQLLQALKAVEHHSPTPIQQEAIPLVLSGRDVLGMAPTGTGKTAAYVLPLLQLLQYAQGMHPRALVLAPSKELVVQIAEQGRLLAQYTDLRVAGLYGGAGLKQQIDALQQGVDWVVATPGRLLDLYRRGALQLRAIKRLVLDEADRLLDLGFGPQMRVIEEILPTKRQNLLFSATLPKSVIQLSEEFLDFPAKVVVKSVNTPLPVISQQLYLVPNWPTKAHLLAHLLLDTAAFCKVLVFVQARQKATQIAHFIARKGTGDVGVIHANKGQNTRLHTLQAFQEGALRVLVATDVAARGLDVPLVSHVISLEPPQRPEDYVHRIGRTSRGQHRGQAITFANRAEQYYVQKIEAFLGQALPIAPLPEALPIVPTSPDEKQAQARALDWQRQQADPTYKGAFHRKKKRR